MSETLELQGRSWQAQQIEEIGQWVSQNPSWSRYRLSRELCIRWSWIRPNGQLADMAARSFLNKLHERALIQLPPCRRASPNRMKHRRLECVTQTRVWWQESWEPWARFTFTKSAEIRSGARSFETLLATEHYLGYRSSVGRTSSICCAPSRIVL